MQVTILWTHAAAQAQGQDTTWTGIADVEATPAELKLHPQDGTDPVVVDREYVIAYNPTETDATD